MLTEAGHGPRPGLMLDVNEAWTRKQAVRHVCELERTLDLIWIEEPVRRWDAEGLAAVGRGVRASVATGENLTGLEQYRPLIAAGAVDIVQMAAVWGVTHFLRVAALAHAHDLPVSPIGNSPVGLLHAATSVPNHLASELQDLRPPVGITLDLHVEDGAFVLGDTPGPGRHGRRGGDPHLSAPVGRADARRPQRPAGAGRPPAAGGGRPGRCRTGHGTSPGCPAPRRTTTTACRPPSGTETPTREGVRMKAVVYRSARHLEVERRDPEPPGPGQLRIAVAYTGICGTDLHIYHGDMDARVGADAVIGHEMSGRVAEVGAGRHRAGRRPAGHRDADALLRPVRRLPARATPTSATP